MKELLVLFNGTSIVRDDGSGVMKDAMASFPNRRILVVCRDNDRIPPPAEAEAVDVSGFVADPDGDYIIIANGGTTSQLVPVLSRIWGLPVPLRVYDLQQRDRPVLLMEAQLEHCRHYGSPYRMISLGEARCPVCGEL